MAWLKIDDNAPLHRKMLAAGPAACWLWVCGLAYCQRHKTDGHIPLEALPWLGVLKPAPMAAVLVRVGLWHADENIGGWLVHDFLDWNASSEERQEKSGLKTERQQRWRDRKRASDTTTEAPVDASTPRLGDAAPTPPPTPSPQPTPQPRPIPPAEGAGGGAPVARETAPRPPRMPGGPPGLLVSPGRYGVEHADHAPGFCAFVCLPGRLVREWAQRVVHAGADAAEAEAQVLAWASHYRDTFVGVPGDDMWAFWKHAWAATHGSNRPSAKPRGHAAGLDALIAQGRPQS